MRSGSPTFVISGMVHFRSNALEMTILKICCGLVRQRIEGQGFGLRITAYLLDVDAVACTAKDQCCAHCLCKTAGLAGGVSPWSERLPFLRWWAQPSYLV